MRGIYKIVNKANRKMYIGESLDILRRWDEHKSLLRNNKHHNNKLQNDWNTYGEDNFKFRIVSVLDDTILNYIDKYVLLIYESKYIHKLDTINNGYNYEDTMNFILNGGERGYNSKILNKYVTKIDNGYIKNKGGIIYLNVCGLKYMCDKLNIERDVFKKMLIQENILILNRRSEKLNEDKINKDFIHTNSSFANCKLYKGGIDYIYDIIKGYVNGDKEIKNNTKEKPIKNKVSNNMEMQDEVNLKILDANNINSDSEGITMKEFISRYTLKTNYNDVFKVLRDNNVLEYKILKNLNQRTNLPTEQFSKYFSIEIKKGKNGDYSILRIKRSGEEVLENKLKELNVIY